jgi:CheY-like chemotaxis protein
VRIAWIDDDLEIIDPVIQPLVGSGDEIALMRTAREALDSVETLRNCDLIILDLILPTGDLTEAFGEYSGIELLRRLRKGYGVAAGVIVLSAVDPETVEEQLDTLNVAAYLRKPALPSELEEIVRVHRSSRRIAWIDDDIEIIDPVIRPLVGSGDEITRMRTVREALDSVETLRNCDLIILDVILPPGDLEEDLGNYSGVPLLLRLREEHGVATPAIVFSVVDPNRVTEKLEQLNVAGYVRKPALPSELKERVDAVLGAQET